ncbi:MAG: zinc ABC transporter solute-binding protein [Kiritimatiellales bacterium]|nr:zinc ABC transporter solute-binding protein [Kiritimatiellales bacterium]
MKYATAVLAAVVLSGCSDEGRLSPASGLTAFVSIPPQAGLLKELAGDRAEIHTLVGEGQSPHAYEPTARQLAKLGEAHMLFTIGVSFEQALLNKISPLYPDLAIVETDAGVARRTMPHEHHGVECEHDHGAKDPHIWLHPLHSMAVARNMLQALEDADPDNADFYRQNFDVLAQKLDRLHATILQRLKPFEGSRFYVFHPSFGYFADEYGLEQVSIELDGKSPSPRQLAGLIEQAKQDGARVVFVQKQFPQDSAEAVATAIGGTVVQVDPLAEDVVANLQEIAQGIEQALAP